MNRPPDPTWEQIIIAALRALAIHRVTGETALEIEARTDLWY